MGGARHFTELVAWQLADELRHVTFGLTKRSGFVRDPKRRMQLEDAVDSICRNISEGFGCESRREFARFLAIARRSLNEVMDCYRSARLKGLVSVEDLTPIHVLARQLYPAISRLRASQLRARPPM